MMDLYSSEDHGRGEISVCNLGAINPVPLKLRQVNGKWTQSSIEAYEKVAYYTLKMVDNVIDLMEYPFPHLALTAKARRNAGIGITGLAYEMALKGLKYSSPEGLTYIHNLAELHSYCLHKASLRLAKERGVCDWAHKTKYPEGWLPIDTYNKNVDTIVDNTLLLDWEGLRKEIISVGGIRNSVLEAHMPCESSSVATGVPNGLYPIRGLTIAKTDGNKKKIFIAPEADTLKDKYEIVWDMTNKQVLNVYAVVQKFTGQAISADWFIRRDVESNGVMKFSAKSLIDDYLYAGWLGVKTRYYSNSENDVESEEDDGCSSGACKM